MQHTSTMEECDPHGPASQSVIPYSQKYGEVARLSTSCSEYWITLASLPGARGVKAMDHSCQGTTWKLSTDSHPPIMMGFS